MPFQRTRFQVTCQICGVAFLAKPYEFAAGRQFCSRTCAYQGRKPTGLPRKPPIVNTCRVCGDAYERTPSRDGPYCSRDCHSQGMSKRSTYVCIVCRSAFERSPSRTGNPLYCGTVCAKVDAPKRMRVWWDTPDFRERQHRAVKSALTGRLRKPPVRMTCQQCGIKRTFIGRDRTRARTLRFCSHACHGVWLRAHPEELRHFRGGSIRRPYYGPDWTDQRRATRQRDSDTCQDCGLHQRRPQLDVHHIIPRRTFGADWQTANTLTNLVTLCKSCHTKRELQLDLEYPSLPPLPPRRRRSA